MLMSEFCVHVNLCSHEQNNGHTGTVNTDTGTYTSTTAHGHIQGYGEKKPGTLKDSKVRFYV